MKELILRKSPAQIGRTMLRHAVGKLMNLPMRAHAYYKSLHNPQYDFSGSRQPAHTLQALNRYVAEYGIMYRENITDHDQKGEMEETSQYYLYKYIEAQAPRANVTVCDIGAFYCGADVHFLKKFPQATVYGLDFGDMLGLNRDIAMDRLKLFPGYPLETLEKLVSEGKRRIFDYVIFARTAALMNHNELFSYMENIRLLANNVCFLEVAKTTSMLTPTLNVRTIPLDKPVKIFNLVRIHNYPALLEKYGFEVVDAAVLPPTTFKQYFVPDHQFIFTAGRNKN